jgi:hypothetical protein
MLIGAGWLRKKLDLQSPGSVARVLGHEVDKWFHRKYSDSLIAFSSKELRGFARAIVAARRHLPEP